MNKSKQLLTEFSKRYEYTRMNLDISLFSNSAELKTKVLKKICSPGYPFIQFFRDYIGNISYYLIAELYNTLYIVKPSKIKNYQLFYDYSNEMYHNFQQIVELYFQEMLNDEKTYTEIAKKLKINVLNLIQESQNATRRNIEVTFDNYEHDRKREYKEKYKKLFIDFLGLGLKIIGIFEKG